MPIKADPYTAFGILSQTRWCGTSCDVCQNSLVRMPKMYA